MPVIFGPTIVEGRVYRGKKKTEEDDEKQALVELQSILNAKGRRVCDCEAQVHELLENCLNCGRLTCESEGPGKCFHCGSIILTQEQRDRLKKFIDITQSFPTLSDSRQQPATSTSFKPSTSNVRIIDNQIDQFAIDNKRHLREEDKAKLKEDLNELQSKRYQRKLVLDIDIDNMEAGASSQPVIDYTDEMRRLQVSEIVETQGADEPTLAEVLAADRSRKEGKAKPTQKERPAKKKQDDDNNDEANK